MNLNCNIQEKDMFEAIKPLIDSGLLNEDAQRQISEAWESKVAQIREEVATEMRSEFASRYEHDKSTMVEALDRMVNENLTREIQEFVEDKNKLVEDRAKFVAEMKEKSSKFEGFLNSFLAKELVEFRNDRKSQASAIAKLENFVTEALAKELSEFAQDKQDLVETKVKLVSEAKAKFEELKKNFVNRSSMAVHEAVNQTLRAEIGQLKEDIRVAQENNFGRKLYEAFASEFAATHLNEHQEIKKLKTALDEMNQQLEESKVATAEALAESEAKQNEIKAINESIAREKTLNELLKPLSKEKAEVMSNLLESVQTDRLKASFDKYLPAVVNGSSKETKILAESVTKEVTGDRTAKVSDLNDEQGNIIEIKRLAGLK